MRFSSGARRLSFGPRHSIANPTRSGSALSTSNPTRHMRSPRHRFMEKPSLVALFSKSDMTVPRCFVLLATPNDRHAATLRRQRPVRNEKMPRSVYWWTLPARVVRQPQGDRGWLVVSRVDFPRPYVKHSRE